MNPRDHVAFTEVLITYFEERPERFAEWGYEETEGAAAVATAVLAMQNLVLIVSGRLVDELDRDDDITAAQQALADFVRSLSETP